MDTTAGQAVPNSSSGPFTLEWTCVPDGRPALSLTHPAPQQVQLPLAEHGNELVAGFRPHRRGG